MIIAIIPARGGSKRIHRKNIKEFLGKPMIEWAIDRARESQIFDKIIVTTDDIEIAEVAKNSGAEVPFMRPESLSDDLTPTVPVIAHAVRELLTVGWPLQFACCIYPGSPFMDVSDLIKAFDLIASGDAKFVYPVTEYAHPVQRSMRKLSDGSMQFLKPQFETTRTQDLETLYHDAGQFYWGTKDAWLEEQKMHSNGLGLVIPNWRVVDIDNLDDWKRAELLGKSFGMTARSVKF